MKLFIKRTIRKRYTKEMNVKSQQKQGLGLFFSFCCNNYRRALTLSSNLVIFLFVISILINPSECSSLKSKAKSNLGEDGMVARTQLELTCFSCTASRTNNTCTEQFRKNVTKNGMDYRCRVYERNGMVVAQGVVPSMLCTSEARNRVTGRIPNNLVGEGPVFVGCCNSDKCNINYCKAIGLNSTFCNTTLGWKKPKPQDASKKASGSIVNTKIIAKKEQPRTKEATTPATSKKDILQNDDPNRQAIKFSEKLENKDTSKKSAPLKTNEPDSDTEAEPRAEELKPEPEGSLATPIKIPSFFNFCGIIYSSFVVISLLLK